MPAPSALAYLRVSSDPQAAPDRVSLEDQEKSIAEYCAAHGYRLVGSYTDVFSGRRDDRREYNRMLAMLQRGEADVVVVKFLDRFGRKPKTILRHIWNLDDLGIKVEATDEDLSHELVTLVRAGLAGEEVKKTSERVKSAMRRRAERGQRVGPLSLGLAADENGRVALDEEWAPLVRTMFRLYVRGDRQHVLGLGYRALAAHLNQSGQLTKAKQPWSASTVKFVLKDKAMVGELTQAGVSQNLPFFVVCPGLFALAQERMAARNANHSEPLRVPGKGQLLSGLVYCAHCGKRMQTYSSPRRYYAPRLGEWRESRSCTYLCGSRVDFGQCAYHGVSVRRLNRVVLEHLLQWCDAATVTALVAVHLERVDGEKEQVAARRRELDRELARLDARIARQVSLWEQGTLDEHQLEVASREARAQRQAALNEVATLEERSRQLAASVRPPSEIAAAVRAAMAQIGANETDIERSRSALAQIVERVVWDGEKAEIRMRISADMV